MNPLTVLSVAFPLAPVSRDSVGGAEQILSQIDEALVQRGHHSVVVACPDSEVAGTLVPTITVENCTSSKEWIVAHQATRKAISYVLQNREIDIVHMHGVDFADYLPSSPVPVLVTLHLPLNCYNAGALSCPRPNTYMHCVSRAQRELSSVPARFLGDIENGVQRELFRSPRPIRKRDFAVSLGRICPEKGFHIALRAAKKAANAMLLAGQVFPFPAHQSYFAEKIAPELDHLRRYIGPAGFRRKRRLLSAAKCLVITSLVPETSSLVAREALACGTPVVALGNGVLREIIDEGKTGFVVSEPDQLPDAIRACKQLDSDECSSAARQRFSSEKMVDSYIAAYRQILERSCQAHQAA